MNGQDFVSLPAGLNPFVFSASDLFFYPTRATPLIGPAAGSYSGHTQPGQGLTEYGVPLSVNFPILDPTAYYNAQGGLSSDRLVDSLVVRFSKISAVNSKTFNGFQDFAKGVLPAANLVPGATSNMLYAYTPNLEPGEYLTAVSVNGVDFWPEVHRVRVRGSGLMIRAESTASTSGPRSLKGSIAGLGVRDQGLRRSGVRIRA